MSGTSPTYDGQWMKLFIEDSVSIFTVPAEKLKFVTNSLRIIKFTLAAGLFWKDIDLILINVKCSPGGSVVWDGPKHEITGWFDGPDLLNSGASKTIWNYVDCASVRYERTVQGITLAPTADFTTTKDNEGGVFVKSYKCECASGCEVRSPTLSSICPFGETQKDGVPVKPPSWILYDHVADFEDPDKHHGWIDDTSKSDAARVSDTMCPQGSSCWKLRGPSGRIFKWINITSEHASDFFEFHFSYNETGSASLYVESQCVEYSNGSTNGAIKSITTISSGSGTKSVRFSASWGCKSMKLILRVHCSSSSSMFFVDEMAVKQLNYQPIYHEDFNGAVPDWWYSGDTSQVFSKRVSSSGLGSGGAWILKDDRAHRSSVYLDIDSRRASSALRYAAVFDFITDKIYSSDSFSMGYTCHNYNPGTDTYSDSQITRVQIWDRKKNGHNRYIVNGKAYRREFVEFVVPHLCHKLEVIFENHGQWGSRTTTIDNLVIYAQYKPYPDTVIHPHAH